MQKNIRSLLIVFSLIFSGLSAQNLNVETIAFLDASGGVTFGPDGNVYVSDFGPGFGMPNGNSRVFKLEYGTWKASEFARGFTGASGGVFDSQGNFYQGNPSANRISKVSPNGSVNLNWVTSGISGGVIGLTLDSQENLYACMCGSNAVRKVTLDGSSMAFASSSLFNCPNGITSDPDDNLYVCNFNDGRILKITPNGAVSLFTTLPRNNNAGNGHITYANGFLFVATIGTGQIYKLSLSGQSELIAGQFQAYSNNDGPAMSASFSKPNGIAASVTGDTLFVNCSVPSWVSNAQALHPGLVRMITGVCSLPDVECESLVTNTSQASLSFENQFANLLTPSPNPAQSIVEVAYKINSIPQYVKIKIMDPLNRVMAEIDEGKKITGTYRVQLDTSIWPSGMYSVILEGRNYVLTRKLVVVK